MQLYYSIEVINKELLKAVLDEQITQDDANALLVKMRTKQRKGIIGTIICVGLFVLSCVIYTLVVKFVKRPADALMIGLLVALFTGFIGTAFTLNSFNIARKYIKALKQGYPQIF
jgi:hypothetical protein